MNTIIWAFILLFVWLVIRSVQQQSMSAQPTRNLIDEDLQKVGYIAGRVFYFACGIADMTAALLLFVRKVLTADDTQNYAGRAITSITALAGKLGDAARRMKARQFLQRGNSRVSASAEFKPEDATVTPDAVESTDEALSVIDCQVVPVQSCEAAAPIKVASVPDFYEAEPEVASADWSLNVDIDPDTEALAIVAGLRAGLSEHHAHIGQTDEAVCTSRIESTEQVQELSVENTGESSQGSTSIALIGSEAPCNALSNSGPIEFAEQIQGQIEGQIQGQVPPALNQGFGTARTRARKNASKTNQPRERSASRSSGPSVPDSVRRLPRNDSAARRQQFGGRQRGGR